MDARVPVFADPVAGCGSVGLLDEPRLLIRDRSWAAVRGLGCEQRVVCRGVCSDPERECLSAWLGEVPGERFWASEELALAVVDAEVGQDVDAFLIADELRDRVLAHPRAICTTAAIRVRSVGLVAQWRTNSPSILR